jgi:hypothetical protein
MILLLAMQGRVLAQTALPSWIPSVQQPSPDQATTQAQIVEFNAEQIDNLVLLAKVWGFLKYHHPVITTGARAWDEELRKILPRILAARNHSDAVSELSAWIESLGSIKKCDSCASLEADTYLNPDIQWISDRRVLGDKLALQLLNIHRNRLPTTQFYIALDPNVGNPIFAHEESYPGDIATDSSLKLLAVFRFWNIVEYWHPYRDLVVGNRDQLLREAIRRMLPTKTTTDVRLQLIWLISRVRDGHAALSDSVTLLPPKGDCWLPFKLRFIGSEPTIFSVEDENVDTGVRIGDVLVAIDGQSANQLVDARRELYSGSNDAALHRDIATLMPRGACSSARLTLRSAGSSRTVTVDRSPSPQRLTSGPPHHDLPGPAFRLLGKDVSYLKLSSATDTDVAGFANSAPSVKGVIVDLRGYPAKFFLYVLGSQMIDAPVTFARFTHPDLSNPGSFVWTPSVELKPSHVIDGETSSSPQLCNCPRKLEILVDETTQSQAEFTAMGLRRIRNASVVGATTAGADGNISFIPLPGGLQASISGIGVYYPDRQKTQQTGIVPDIAVTPTAEGVREGRDEILDAALAEILGREIPRAQLQKLYGEPPALH